MAHIPHYVSVCVNIHVYECARLPAHMFMYTCPPPNIINISGKEANFLSLPGLFQAVPRGFTRAKNTTCYIGVCYAEEVVKAWILAW